MATRTVKPRSMRQAENANAGITTSANATKPIASSKTRSSKRDVRTYRNNRRNDIQDEQQVVERRSEQNAGKRREGHSTNRDTSIIDLTEENSNDPRHGILLSNDLEASDEKRIVAQPAAQPIIVEENHGGAYKSAGDIVNSFEDSQYDTERDMDNNEQVARSMENGREYGGQQDARDPPTTSSSDCSSDLSNDHLQKTEILSNTVLPNKSANEIRKEEFENDEEERELQTTTKSVAKSPVVSASNNPISSTAMNCYPCGVGADVVENREEGSDDFAGTCTWYLCSAGGGDKDDKDERKLDTSLPIESKRDQKENETKGMWNSMKYWIDPAPTGLIQSSLEQAVVNTIVNEMELNGTSTDPAPKSKEDKSPLDDDDDEANLSSTSGAVDAPFGEENQLAVPLDGALELDNKNVEVDKEFDQDSGIVSDAELNSICAMATNKTVEPQQKKILPQSAAHISAFEPVKSSRLSPATTLEKNPSEQNDEVFERCDDRNTVSFDGSTSTSNNNNLLTNEMKSIPSVVDDVDIEIADLQPTDLISDQTQPDSTSIAESLAKIKLRESAEKQLQSPDTKKVDQSSEFKRQTLVKELRSAISTYGRYDIKCAHISCELGELLDVLGDHAHSIRLYKDATTIYSCKLGEDHSKTLETKMKLAHVFENAQLYDDAMNLYYLVTVMRRAMDGENHPSVADGLVCMAQTLRKKGDFVQAIKELKRALKIYRESLGDAHEKVANTVDHIASLYVTIGDFDKSAAILEEVVKLKAATMGMSSKAVAQTLSTLATTYECSEKFYNAMKALKKAYKIYTEIGGYTSEESTSILNRIAQLYEATGDQHRASIAYLGVLRARKILRGSDSLSVGETYFRLGHSLRETGQFDKALKCLKEALPIFIGQGVEMNDMKMVADIMHEIAFINQDIGNYHEAVRIFKQELSVRRKIGQPEFPLVARTLNHLGVAEFELQNNNKALKYFVEALSIFQERGGEQGIECAEVLFNTGLVFEAVRNTKRAYEAYTEACRIFREHGYGDDHPHLRKAIEKATKIRKDT